MLQFMRNLTIGRKLILLLTMPAILVFWFASVQIQSRLDDYQVAKRVDNASEVVAVIGELIGALQAERGASGVVISSQGQRFSDRLQQLRQDSDRNLILLQQLPNPKVLPLQQQLSALATIRQQVDSFTLSANKSAEQYTALIRLLMDFNQQLEKSLNHLLMVKQLNLLNQLIEMKERAGRERAILGLAFSQDYFTPELLNRYTNNLGAYHAYEENVLKALTTIQLKRFRELTLDPSFTEVNRLQQLAFNVTLGGSLGFDSGKWFDISTKRINLLAQFEQELSVEITQQASQLAAKARQDLTILATLLGLTLIAIYFLASAIINNIRIAVSEIVHVVEALAAHDLTQRSKYRGNDEFGKISQLINEQAAELQQIVQKINDATVKVSAAAMESAAVTIQTNQGVQQQQQDTHMVATAMHEMSATVKDVAKSTSEAAELSEQVQQSADAGQQTLRQTIALIERLAEQVTGTSDVITKVKQDSTAITSVLDVIRGIAEQTNLLALNAAIEAARAGEQGRGFAVVADEVRTLAQRTAKSTGDIQSMIEALQQGTQQAADATAKSLEQAKYSTSNVHQTGEILTKVLEGIKGINDKNIQIASAAEEQTTVADEINQKVLSISDVAAETSTAAQQTAATSHELALLAEQLKSLIKQFKLT